MARPTIFAECGFFFSARLAVLVQDEVESRIRTMLPSIARSNSLPACQGQPKARQGYS
jgi:hypothetical protein